MAVCDLNYHLKEDAYENFLTVDATCHTGTAPRANRSAIRLSSHWSVAAEAKYRLWLPYNWNPTRRNNDLHRQAFRRMVAPTAQARRGRPVRHVQDPQAGRPAPRYTPAAMGDNSPILHHGRPQLIDQQLIVTFARTETFFRSFLPRYSRLWNRIVRQTDIHQAATLHIFKCSVNA
ncbi:hypothetical protein GWK47_024537 [Chionoecetes opilio]|uniref:Uncharacterized protein n=1 Tax=Chionoecetes opilio TaxID=41210 RepID=A0A8J5BT72_CHIOP|nr:hypothetical protein GWK47_024537 [Chionoecetes opilio]